MAKVCLRQTYKMSSSDLHPLTYSMDLSAYKGSERTNRSSGGYTTGSAGLDRTYDPQDILTSDFVFISISYSYCIIQFVSMCVYPSPIITSEPRDLSPRSFLQIL